MALSIPVLASAATIYDQTLDSSAAVSLGHGGFAPIIGSFTITSTTTISDSSYTNIAVKSISRPDAGPIVVSVTTGPGCSGVVLSYAAPLPGADSLFHSLNLATSTVSGDLSPGTYNICADNYSIFNNTEVQTDSIQTNFFGYITNDGVAPEFNRATRIIVTIPANKQTIASSTDAIIGNHVYINSSQMTDALAANNSKWFVQVTITSLSPIKQTTLSQSFGAFGTVFDNKTFKFPIDGESGLINFSTTTPLTNFGDYTMTTQIIQPNPYNQILQWFGFGSATILDATTTVFTVAKSTGFDTLQASTTDSISAFLASTTPALKDACAAWTSFSLADCLNLLFIPQAGDLSRVMNDLNTGLFAYAPFGYVTRFNNILTGQATSSFPMLSTSMPDPSNPSEMMTYTFDQNEALAGAGTLLDNLKIPQAPDINVRGSMDDIVKTVIALAVFSYIFYDLIKSSRGQHHAVRTKLS